MNTSRRMKAVVSIAALSLLLASTALAFQGKQDFTVINKTGVEIHELYVSPHSAADWQEDVLGADTLPSGQSVEIKFSPREKAKLWDLKIVDGEGNSIEWTRLNLLEISEVTLFYKNGKAWAETK
ncbi:MAG TPA: hypothetical protein VK421_08220 [Pyrinomonadaceae bacterium]|nr:hypothetical protein [Pyrinomonadaceae bacterium]